MPSDSERKLLTNSESYSKFKTRMIEVLDGLGNDWRGNGLGVGASPESLLRLTNSYGQGPSLLKTRTFNSILNQMQISDEIKRELSELRRVAEADLKKLWSEQQEKKQQRPAKSQRDYEVPISELKKPRRPLQRSVRVGIIVIVTVLVCGTAIFLNQFQWIPDVGFRPRVVIRGEALSSENWGELNLVTTLDIGASVVDLAVIDEANVVYTQGNGEVIRINLLNGMPETLGQGEGWMGIAANSERSLVVTGDRTGWLRRWTVSEPRASMGFYDSQERVRTVAWHPHDWIASGNSQGVVRLWNLATDDAVGEFVYCSECEVRGLAFSADSKWLLIGGETGRVVRWDLISGVEELLETTHIGVSSVAYSSNNRWFAVGREDGRVLVWNAENMLIAHEWITESPVLKVLFDNTNEVAIVGLDNGNIQIWSLATGEKITELSTGGAGIRAIGMDLDRRWVVTGSSCANLPDTAECSGKIHVWAVKK